MDFVTEVMQLRGNEVDVVSMDGKTVGGVWENSEQLKVLHLFSQEGSVALGEARLHRGMTLWSTRT